MSALSFPSLISDSSSLSRGSDLDELTHERLIRASLTINSTASIPLPPGDPENSGVGQLRSRVSKLEQDNFVLGEYAAESRIRRLESERMEHQDLINDSQELELPSTVMPSSFSRPSSPTNNTYSISRNRTSLHRPSSSLSATISTTSKRVPAPSSSRGTPSSSSSQLAPSKTKLVPKRSLRVESSEVFASPQSETSLRQRNCEYESMTPTRRRLQAMYGLFSSESSPSLGKGDPIPTGLDGCEPNSPHVACPVRVPYSKGTTQDNTRDQETKRPTFTSKLDSIILTSKLFPLSSSRSKTPLSPASQDHRTPTSHTAVIPLVRVATSSTPHPSNIVLNSPPSKNAKVQLPRKSHNLLSQSLGLEENRHPHPNSKGADQKLAPGTRGRVSFSERLFSPPDRKDETDPGTEQTRRMWGSWSQKRRPPPMSFIDEKRGSSPSFSPLLASPSHISKDSDDRRRGKRTSLAPGCLKTLVSGSGDQDKITVGGHDGRLVPRRSYSESRRPDPVLRSNSGRSTTNSRPSEYGEQGGASMRSKGDGKRITPSRVGSPMPQSRLPELQGGNELERVNSMRSTGKWGHRGRQFSAELTRRRTIHPMFSFERPGSIDAASTSSSKRCDGIEDDVMSHERRGVVDNSRRLPRRASPSPLLIKLPSHEADASQPQTAHTQDYSEASGHSGGTGLSRLDPGPAGKTPMMRTRLGIQSHGTFAFEPATAVVCSPRSTPAAGIEDDRAVKFTGGSLSKRKGVALVRSLTDVHARDQRPSISVSRAVNDVTKGQEYLEFCKELKAALGDGEDWCSFKKYVRRFDLEVLSADVLMQRVKKLLDGRRTVDSATRLRVYEQFVKVVHDNLNE